MNMNDKNVKKKNMYTYSTSLSTNSKHKRLNAQRGAVHTNKSASNSPGAFITHKATVQMFLSRAGESTKVAHGIKRSGRIIISGR